MEGIKVRRSSLHIFMSVYSVNMSEAKGMSHYTESSSSLGHPENTGVTILCFPPHDRNTFFYLMQWFSNQGCNCRCQKLGVCSFARAAVKKDH